MLSPSRATKRALGMSVATVLTGAYRHSAVSAPVQDQRRCLNTRQQVADVQTVMVFDITDCGLARHAVKERLSHVVLRFYRATWEHNLSDRTAGKGPTVTNEGSQDANGLRVPQVPTASERPREDEARDPLRILRGVGCAQYGPLRPTNHVELLEAKVVNDGIDIRQLGFQRDVANLPLGGADAATIETHHEPAAGEAFEIAPGLGLREVRIQRPTPGPNANQGRSGAQGTVSDARAVRAGAETEFQVHIRA